MSTMDKGPSPRDSVVCRVSEHDPGTTLRLRIVNEHPTRLLTANTPFRWKTKYDEWPPIPKWRAAIVGIYRGIVPFQLSE